MALLLLALGLFIYLRFTAQINVTIDQGLRSRADDVAALVQQTESGLREAPRSVLIEREESFAQILTPRGRIFDTTPQLGSTAVLDRSVLQSAAQGALTVEQEGLPGIDGTARLLATPVSAQDRQLIVVVGASLEERDESSTNLATLLGIGGPVALILASLAGYGMATAAMRPVEAMRRRAAALSADDVHERLPLSEADDELRRLAETLNGMLGRLEAAIERERVFVDDASHELRTPLALHKTELELALRYGESVDELKESIASAIEEADRVIQLAESLLVVARAEKGRLALEPELMLVEDLFSDLASRFATRTGKSDRPIVFDAQATPTTLEADRLRLEQALTNMLDNALRHGGGEVRIWSRTANGRVELHVSDDGPGFPAEFLDKAFDRFSRADEARARGGTGLGLAIVATIAEAHGGSAHATNKPTGGADVWIEIPAHVDDLG